MKTKFLYIAALALLVSFTACENNEPYDTQSEDDAPIFLKPFETEDGLVYGKATNPDPYVDSVLVTPSAYTTVNWYVDDQLVHTGLKIEKCFPTGTYDLLIEAVTTAGKRTTRFGVLTVEPAAEDPYAAAASGAHHLAPGVEMTISGKNLDKVVKIILASDMYGTNTVCTVEPSAKTASSLKLTLPAVEVGKYYLMLQGEDGALYGSDKVEVHDSPLVLSRYDYFAPNDPWTIRGVKLQDAVSVWVGAVEITSITATASSITFTAPDLDYGTYMLSIQNKDGSPVMFSTDNGLASEVAAECGPKRLLWEGPVNIDWDDQILRISAAEMAKVQVDDTIFIHYTIIPAEYHCIRVTTPMWEKAPDVLSQVDEMANEDKPNPYAFVYTEEAKSTVEQNGAACVVGFGLSVDRIRFRRP